MKYGFLEDVNDVNFQLPEAPSFATKLLPNHKHSTNFYIGSSVWADKDFKGHFYPEKTPQKDFLKAYSSQFNAVEVNATRYGVPKQKTLETWRSSVPDYFRFSFKMPQIISQRKNLLDNDVLARLDDFLLGMDFMREKAGTTFILLLNSFGMDRLPELESFLARLPKEQSFAIECRNPQVNATEQFNVLLHKYNVANVITDTAGRRDVVHRIVTGNKAFVRFVGNGLVETDYNRIKDWTTIFNDWTKAGVQEIVCLHHQPNQHRSFSGYSAKFMIEQILKQVTTTNLKAPTVLKTNELF